MRALTCLLFGCDWGPENAQCERCSRWNPRLERAKRQWRNDNTNDE